MGTKPTESRPPALILAQMDVGVDVSRRWKRRRETVSQAHDEAEAEAERRRRLRGRARDRETGVVHG